MSDYVDVMQFSVTPQGEIVVMVGEAQASSAADLLAMAPNASPANWAEILNELATSGEFELILDPDAFQAQYEATMAEEDPEKGWSQDAMRLRDFGIPDFSSVSPPQRNGSTLVYFARDIFNGLPYRAEVNLAEGDGVPVYDPLPLSATPEPAAVVTPVDELPDDIDDVEEEDEEAPDTQN